MSPIEIRPIRRAELLRLSSYAFGPSPQPYEQLQQEAERPEKTFDAVRLGAFDGDTAVAAAVGLSMRQNLRGKLLPMLGVASVSTHPSARRRGHVRNLLGRLHDDFATDNFAVAALWPFRPSFYERFGYVNFQRPRQIRLFPSGMKRLRNLDLPGEVTLHRWSEQAEEVAYYLGRVQPHRHGFALVGRERLTDVQQDAWVAFARRDSVVVGMLSYQTDGIGGALRGRTLLYDDPTARMLLLQWLALHEDQFESFRFVVPSGDAPELWYSDACYDDETDVRMSTRTAPMARVLSVPGLAGITVGQAVATVRVVDDPYVGGVWTFDGTDGTLAVSRAEENNESSANPISENAITAHGLSALVYGVLRAEDLSLHGYGAVDATAAHALNTLFPRAEPFLYSQF